VEETKASCISRSPAMDKESLIAHLKTVGQRIVDDAEMVGSDPEHTREIYISARISPFESITSIDYEITRAADPRLK